MEVFELTTPTLNIPSQSHTFAEVSFTPQTIQLYNAMFEVTMEGASRYKHACLSVVCPFTATANVQCFAHYRPHLFFFSPSDSE